MKIAIEVGLARSSCSKRLSLYRPSRREDEGRDRSVWETSLGFPVPRVRRGTQVVGPRFVVANQLSHVAKACQSP